jgi:hypothetical protein
VRINYLFNPQHTLVVAPLFRFAGARTDSESIPPTFYLYSLVPLKLENCGEGLTFEASNLQDIGQEGEEAGVKVE